MTFCGGNVLCQKTLSGETFLTGNILSFVAGNIYFWQEVFVSRNLFVEHFLVNILWNVMFYSMKRFVSRNIVWGNILWPGTFCGRKHFVSRIVRKHFVGKCFVEETLCVKKHCVGKRLLGFWKILWETFYKCSAQTECFF